jgi:hypothetical protein
MAYSDPRDRGLYTAGAVCDECGFPSPRVRICGECETAMKCDEEHQKVLAPIVAERDQLRAEVNEWRALAPLLGHSTTTASPAQVEQSIRATLNTEDMQAQRAFKAETERDQLKARVAELERENHEYQRCNLELAETADRLERERDAARDEIRALAVEVDKVCDERDAWKAKYLEARKSGYEEGRDEERAAVVASLRRQVEGLRLMRRMQLTRYVEQLADDFERGEHVQAAEKEKG